SGDADDDDQFFTELSGTSLRPWRCWSHPTNAQGSLRGAFDRAALVVGPVRRVLDTLEVRGRAQRRTESDGLLFSRRRGESSPLCRSQFALFGAGAGSSRALPLSQDSDPVA